MLVSIPRSNLDPISEDQIHRAVKVQFGILTDNVKKG